MVKEIELNIEKDSTLSIDLRSIRPNKIDCVISNDFHKQYKDLHYNLINEFINKHFEFSSIPGKNIKPLKLYSNSRHEDDNLSFNTYCSYSNFLTLITQFTGSNISCGEGSIGTFNHLFTLNYISQLEIYDKTINANIKLRVKLKNKIDNTNITDYNNLMIGKLLMCYFMIRIHNYEELRGNACLYHLTFVKNRMYDFYYKFLINHNIALTEINYFNTNSTSELTSITILSQDLISKVLSKTVVLENILNTEQLDD